MLNKLLITFAGTLAMTGSGIILAVPAQDLTTNLKIVCVVMQAFGTALAAAWNIRLPGKEETK
jgi:hypothetical protein